MSELSVAPGTIASIRMALNLQIWIVGGSAVKLDLAVALTGIPEQPEFLKSAPGWCAS